MEISLGTFESQRNRRFGASNPERMPLAFWEAMIRGHEDARLYEAFAERDRTVLGHWPAAVREYFGQIGDYSKGEIWIFSRMGATRTPLPDGRIICVGGEHEDFYDPDFCIYNDVVVLDIDGTVEIYGYPRDVFPPTDFHTATVVGDRILIIGSVGYGEDRRPASTPVFALSLADYSIEALPSRGEVPGWIFGHEATRGPDGIVISGGEFIEEASGRTRRNFDDFAYDVATGDWKKLTDRRWRQFSIKDMGGKGFLPGPRFLGCPGAEQDSWKGTPPIDAELDDPFVYVNREALVPDSFAYQILETDEISLDQRLLVGEIPVSISLGPFSIEVIVEGGMADAAELVEDIRESVEVDTGRPCVLEAYD